MSEPDLTRRALALLTVLCGLPHAGHAQPAETPMPLADAANGIALRALGGLAATGQPAALLSPLSLADACALLVPAAVEGAAEALRGAFRLAEGAETMAPFLALDAALARDAARGSLRRATALWLRAGSEPLPAYAAAIRPLSTLSRRTVEFTAPDAVQRINAWVAEATAGRIRDILRPPLPPLTNMVITAALHFRADWARRFDAAATRPGPFRRADGSTLSVPLMNGMSHGAYAREGAVHAVRLPYADAAFDFLAVAPAPGAPVDAVSAPLRAGRMDALLRRLRFADAPEIVLALPRCEAEARTDLIAALRPTPLGPALVPEAEYRGMLGVPTQIDRAVQKVFLRMDEVGTEAAAATAVVGVARGVRTAPTRPVFRADAPFLVGVRHRASGIFVVLALIAEPQAPRA